MSNLSDSDNFNNDNNVLKIDASKRRGRPKKGFFTEKPKQSNPSKEFNNNEKDLILHLPVKLVKKENNKNEDEKKQDNKKYENINKIKSDDLLSSFDSDSIKSDDDYDSTFDDDILENSKNNDDNNNDNNNDNDNHNDNDNDNDNYDYNNENNNEDN